MLKSYWWPFRAAFSGTGRERGEHVLIPFDLLKAGLHIQRCQNWKRKGGPFHPKKWFKMLKSYSVSFSGREMRWPSKHSPIHTIYSISPFYWLNHYSICLKRIKRIINDIKCECIKSVFCNLFLNCGPLFWRCVYTHSRGSLENLGTKYFFNGCIVFLVVSGQIEIDSYLLVISIVSNNILGCPLASPITSYIEKVWALN